MKILMISEYFPPYSKGGGEISAFLLAKELAKKNIDVTILTSQFKGLKKTEIISGVKILRLLKTGLIPGSIKGNIERQKHFEKSLLDNLEKIAERYDVIHCMNTTSISAVKLKKKINKSFVLHVNGPVLFCPKGTLMYKDKEICEKKCTLPIYLDCFLNSQNIGKIKMTFYIKYNPAVIYLARKKFNEYQSLLPTFDHYIAISSYMKQRLIFSGIKEKKISVVYNIVEYDKFLELRQQKNKIKKILYLGPYTEPKGPQILLKALNSLESKFEANFYGKGPLEEYLKKNSGKKIHINKQLPYSDIPKIIKNHDILVFPSLVGEAFGRVALEACGAGKIVIASNIGGIPDIVEDSKTGYLFEAGNIGQLKEILKKTISERLKISPNIIRKNIKQKFSPETSVKKTIKIYKELKNG